MRRAWCATLVLLAVGTAGAAELYRWVDDQGVTHFGDRPPANVQAQPLETPPPPPAGEVQDAQRRLEALRAAADERAQERARQEEEAADRTAAADRMEQECAAARAELEGMESARRVLRPDGSVLYGEDRLRLMDKLRRDIAEHCR